MNFNNNLPIYLQIKEKIVFLIITEVYKSNDKLPSVREFATEYEVNPNTVQKALSILETEKLTYTKRTNGTYVTVNKDLINKYKDKLIKEKTNDYLDSMQKLKVNNEDILNIIRGEMK